jgi:acyl-CoA synthetase (AMP-forming)/AMP-acid ligase II
MGVPTMYAILIAVYQEMSEEQQREARQAAAALRLTISGSAACPVPIMSAWRDISGSIPKTRRNALPSCCVFFFFWFYHFFLVFFSSFSSGFSSGLF